VITPAARGTHAVENAEVARLFREMADVLEVEGANPFRVRAYRTAARTVEGLPESVDAIARTTPKRLAELPGIGKDLAGKITQIVKSGRLPALVEAEREAPVGAVALMHIPGIGPKRARALCEELHVRTIAGLERAARAGRIHEIPGFGERTEKKILEEIAGRGTEEHRVLRAVAAQYAEPLLAYVRELPGVRRAELAGSFRRCKETVGDLDILVAADDDAGVAAGFVAYPEVQRVLARGRTKASILLRSGLQVDLRVLADESFGAGLHYFTGSKAHNIAVRHLGQKLGLKINEYGIFRGRQRVGGATEAEVFDAVGLPMIPPELRENDGEIEAARAGALPRLVALKHIRGDLQVHTTDSDGRDSLDAIVAAAKELGYEYIAVTDHTPAVRVAGGMDRAGFKRQMRRIERLNALRSGLTILKGAEVDINADGTLDLDDATMAELDIVIVALHSKLTLSAEQQTRRLVKALAHPSVDILGHPAARLIGSRRGAMFDRDAVFRAAAEHGVMVEVNCQPERLDLDDVGCRAATAHGLTMVISTDAHAAAEMRYMRWGVDQARRGWVERKRVANTRPLEGLVKLLHRERR
jgi:DNA polymerase (family 10)